MKQKRKWFLSSATDDTNLTEINFKIELLVDGEPNKDLVDFMMVDLYHNQLKVILILKELIV
jgi:hypothetical protein